jgi:Mg-chelatase subunit ChlD
VKRRPVSAFSLSFLDIMFCGFGAVVLLVLILNRDTVRARTETFSDLRSEVVRLEKEVLLGDEQRVTARNSLQASDKELVTTEGEAEQLIRDIRELEIEIARMEKQTLANRQHVNQLSADLKNLDDEKKRLGAVAADERDEGDKVRRVIGEGDRQYLTGLKVGGKRILILVDSSASMLDETIINVIRRRNMAVSQRRSAPKWKRTLATLGWLVGNLPADARFQLYTFNTRARAALSGSEGKWLAAGSPEELEAAVSALHKTVPAGGTSLYHAFAVAKELSPRPDNILLITDGLPTQGRNKPKGTTVSSDERLAHFEKASRSLPKGVPVNTILMPMEGDAWAAAAYWRLAINTRGSFLTPARDWP